MRDRRLPDIDWGALMPAVARALLGDPPRKHGGQWRYGRKGSLVVHVSGDRAGQWYNFEDDEGGGVLALIEHRAGLTAEGNHRAALGWLQERGLIPAAGESPRRTRSRPTPEPPSHTDEGTSNNRERAAQIAQARAVLNASVAGDGTPARAYLAGRLAWPPDGVGPDLPPSVRWIARSQWPAVRSLPSLPPGVSSAIVYRYDDPKGEPQAIDVEALENARRLRGGDRWRRTFGSRDLGPLFRAGGDPNGSGWSLCEGAIDALACRWLWPETAAVAVGGSSKLKSVNTTPFTGAPVRIVADGDSGGRVAGERARNKLLGAGCEVRVVWCAVDDDPASELAEHLRERAAVMEFEGAVDRADAERAAWGILLENDDV